MNRAVSEVLERRLMLIVSVEDMSFDWTTPPDPQTIEFDFSGVVEPTLDDQDLHLENLTTADALAPLLTSYAMGDVATFTVPGLTNGMLANGNYQATIFADAVLGPDGLPMNEDADLMFFFLKYDIWGTELVPDRLVGLQDYNRLGAHFGQAGDYSRGDLNLDGLVNIQDFNLLAANWGATLAMPPAPGTIEVSNGYSELMVTWNLGAIPADCTGIRIQRSTDGQTFTSYATLEGTEQKSFIDDGDSDPSAGGPGLPAGSRFFYRARAIGGVSGGTGYTPKKGGNTVMDPPQNVIATAYSATEILVQWIDVTMTETRFSLEVTESGGDTWVIPNIPANQTGTGSFIVSGLQPGVAYSFRMQAWGPGLESIWTLPTDPVAPDSSLTPPSPTLHGVAVDNPYDPHLLLVNSSATGAPSEVAVELSTDHGDFIEVYRAPPGVNPIMIPATEGTSYLVRMRSFKNGIPSPYSDLKDIHAAPLAPANFRVVESQPTTTLTLNWEDRSQKETGYELLVKGSGGAILARFELPVDSESKFIGNLKEGTGYGFDVRAIADSGSSSAASTGVTTKLSAPTNLIADPIHPTEMNLTWDDRSNNEMLYRVTYSPPPPPPPPNLDYEYFAMAPRNSTGMPLIGLEPATQYDLTVRAAMSIQYGQRSDPASSAATTPPASAPPESVPQPHPPAQPPPQGTTVYSWTIGGNPKWNTDFQNSGQLTFGGEYSTPWSLTRLPLGAALGQVSGTITSVNGSDVKHFTYPGDAFRVARTPQGFGPEGVTIWLEDQTGRDPNDYDYDDGYWHVTLTSMTVGTVPPPLPPAPPPPQTHQDGLPWVWITTTDVVGSEIPDPGQSSPGPIEFTVWRSAPTTGSLTVHLFPAAGTATSNDYTGIPSSVTIPAGSDHKSFTVTPVPDLLIEGMETVSVLLKANASYHLTYGYEATAVIRDNTPDLDIDSDNDNGFIGPARSPFEDDIEDDADKPGKVIAVNDDDSDADGIPDYADGFDLFPDTTLDDFTNGEQFVPLYVALPAGLSTQTTLKLVYDDSPPLAVTRSETEPYVYTPGPGTLRVWKNMGRTAPTIEDGGAWWQDGGTYTLSQLGMSPFQTSKIFHLEAIRPTGGTVADRIELWIDPDGNAGPAGMIFADAVRVTSYPGLIGIDADRDGTIRFSPDDSSQSDRTASNRPYRFWLNNDSDGSIFFGIGENERLLGDPHFFVDSSRARIESRRDQEDWGRITIKPPPGYDPQDNTWTVRLRSVAADAEAAMTLRFTGVTKEEGDTYLIDPAVDLIDSVVSPPLKPGQSLSLPAASAVIAEDGQADLLFEGVVAGDATLWVEFWHGSAKVAEDSVHLKLMSIRKMYEERTVGDTNHWGDPKVQPIAQNATRHPTSGEYTGQSPETNDVIVFVHGWRMQPAERRNYAETAYKRLFWQGFKGRFFLYSWPTQWVDTDAEWFRLIPWRAIGDPGNYGRSQEIAFYSARALANLLKALHQTYGGATGGKINMFSHSMGGVVASEALRILTTEQTVPIVHTYVASQSVVSADAYKGGSTIPYPPEFNGYLGGGGTGPWFRNINQAAQKIVNFYNPNDYALNRWNRNNELKPHFMSNGTTISKIFGFDAKYALYSDFNQEIRVWYRVGAQGTLSFANNTYEMFSYLAIELRPPVGRLAVKNESGPVTEDVRLNVAPYSFENDHSGQWSLDITRRWHYWDELLKQFDLKPR